MSHKPKDQAIDDSRARWPDRDDPDFLRFRVMMLAELQELRDSQTEEEDYETVNEVHTELEGETTSELFVAWAAYQVWLRTQPTDVDAVDDVPKPNEPTQELLYFGTETDVIHAKRPSPGEPITRGSMLKVPGRTHYVATIRGRGAIYHLKLPADEVAIITTGEPHDFVGDGSTCEKCGEGRCFYLHTDPEEDPVAAPPPVPKPTHARSCNVCGQLVTGAADLKEGDVCPCCHSGRLGASVPLPSVVRREPGAPEVCPVWCPLMRRDREGR
jgi:hypothetical protein